MEHQNNIRKKYEKIFDYNFNKLNDEQRSAVLATEGPVMVLAGPGTGKTQILAVRIGQILRQSDIAAHNILCLTFTEAATTAMRQRLVKIIGPEAHKVHIYTFHGFCNQVIQENLNIFGNYRKLEAISDLEKIDVYTELIDALPADHALKRLKGDPTYEHKRLANLFALMKKEDLDVKTFEDRLEQFLRDKKDSDDFTYKRKTTSKGKTYVKGDFNENKWATFSKKYEELAAGIKLFPAFNKIMDEKSLYDYQDMILWVLKAFEKDPDLLASYQERYQYFLVDEYQDTNGAQNKILDLLFSGAIDSANAFVVGDDDQAIYKFQGANVDNIKDFKNNYAPEIIVLEKNYRSSQTILDSCSALIAFNTERLIHEADLQISKALIASGPDASITNPPIIRSYDNVVHEQAAIVEKLSTMHERGEDMSDMAIIYRQHNQIEKLVEVLEKKQVPLNIKRKIDILKLPLIDNLLKILTYLQSEYSNPNSQEVLLFELLHYNFFRLPTKDIAKLALYCREGGSNKAPFYRDVMGDKEILKEINIHAIEDFLHIDNLLGKWTADIANVTLQNLFENVLNEGNILKSILQHPQKTWLLQVISTLFDHIKDESNKRPDMKLIDFLTTINKMKDSNLKLEINKIVHSDQGIHFITAHSAKGLEFDKVFMLGCTKNIWDKNSRNFNSFSYPENVNEDTTNNTQDERRLFFVAMTRAKTQLEISYSKQTETGKELGASQFVDEILGATELELTPTIVGVDNINEFQALCLTKVNKEIALIDHDLIDKILTRYKLSVTGLNKYLRCPMSFYFDTILQVPTARNKYMGFGRAIHKALQLYYEDKKRGQSPDKATLNKYYIQGMREHRSHFTEKEYKDLTDYGLLILPQYYDANMVMEPVVKDYALEIKIDHAEHQGVPLKGVLDKVEVYKDHVNVVDFKTGKWKKPDTNKKLKGISDKNELGGDYWRQIVYYRILIDSDKKHNWVMNAGFIDFVEPDRSSGEFKKQKIVVSIDDIAIVGEQIKETWENIHAHKFNQLCEDEHCYWCEFVRNDYVFNDELELDKLEDIQEE